MLDDQIDQKPCLIKVEQGFSIYYKNRYLYSKYNPESTLKKTISQLPVPNNTLILAFSAILPYGLNELLEKTPDDSFILLVEQDKKLFELARTQLPIEILNNKKIQFAFCPNLNSYIDVIQNLGINNGVFRKTVRIDMSAASRMENIYDTYQKIADSAIAQFWKNRMTLTKLGRLYSRNLMQNLAYLPFTDKIQCNSIDKPILIVGAGPSLDALINLIKINMHNLYIVAVDSAINVLLSHKINIDAIVAVECQLANEKAFLGCNIDNIPLFADLTSRPQLLKKSKKTALFISEFAKIDFFRKLKNREILPLTIPPLGSVGLSAIELALLIRRHNAPIILAGLDFSFIPGKTHCNGSPAHINQLITQTRLKSLEDPASAFKMGAGKVRGKNDEFVITDKILATYGSTLSINYAKNIMIFDISQTGLYCGIPFLSKTQFQDMLDSKFKPFPQNEMQGKNQKSKKIFDYKLIDKVKIFYEEELKALNKLNTILSTGGDINEALLLLANREYLYLHFPDGYKKPTADTSFLKRIRAETDFFIKEIKRGKKTLESFLFCFKNS